jgi:hypothetical protein
MKATENQLPKYDSRYRERPEYDEGRCAFRDGKTADANPYPSGPATGDRRYFWFMGFYDERTRQRS